VGGAGSFEPDLSPPRLAAARLRVSMVNTPPARIRRIIFVPPSAEFGLVYVVETSSRHKIVERRGAKSTMEKKSQGPSEM
jgi:hypothetical protein